MKSNGIKNEDRRVEKPFAVTVLDATLQAGEPMAVDGCMIVM